MLERYLAEIWAILQDLSGPLLLGTLIAGIIHVILPRHLIKHNLGGKDFRSVLNAVLIGVPMPLCSCSVVPAAIGLKQEGASKGAATGFLISTPQTGVDSILVSATFLGWPFALFKVVAAFITGLIGGVLVNKLESGSNDQSAKSHPSGMQELDRTPGGSRVVEALRYGLFDLLGMIYRWIALGIAVAAAITILLPPDSLVGKNWTGGIGGMLLMLLIALPLYVCTTGSVPIAGSLIAAGMPLGTALVFLMAGPATNIATMGAVTRAFGARVLVIYLVTIAVFSVVFGLFFDFVIAAAPTIMPHEHGGGAGYFNQLLSITVIGLFAFLFAYDLYNKRIKSGSKVFREGSDLQIELKIKGMTCRHCAATVTKALSGVPGVRKADVDVDKGLAVVDGDAAAEVLIQSVREAGYEAAVIKN